MEHGGAPFHAKKQAGRLCLFVIMAHGTEHQNGGGLPGRRQADPTAEQFFMSGVSPTMSASAKNCDMAMPDPLHAVSSVATEGTVFLLKMLPMADCARPHSFESLYSVHPRSRNNCRSRACVSIGTSAWGTAVPAFSSGTNGWRATPPRSSPYLTKKRAEPKTPSTTREGSAYP